MVCKLDYNITIEKTKDLDLVEQIMTNKMLFKASMPDDDIAALEAGTWKPDPNVEYLVAKRDGDPIGIIRLYRISNLTIDIHYHILPIQWGTGVSSEVHKKLEEYLREFTVYCKLLIQTPQCCREVLQASVREGFKLEGILTAAIKWRDNIENIVLMTKPLLRENVNG